MNGTIIHPPGTNWQDVADLNYGNKELTKMIRLGVEIYQAEGLI